MKYVCMMLCVALITGCSTLMVRDPYPGCGGPPGPKGLYPATRGDFKSIGFVWTDVAEDQPFCAAISTIFLVIDVPISLVTDTVCLPFDVVATRTKTHEREKQQQEEPEPAPGPVPSKAAADGAL